MVYLRIAGTDFPVQEGTITLGRSKENSIVIEHPKISFTHLSITRQEGGSFLLKDHNSTNGTIVDGKRITAVQVPLNSQFFIAGLDAVFIDDTPSMQTPLLDALKKKVHDRLLGRMDLKKVDLKKLGDQELRIKTEAAIREIIRELGDEITAATDTGRLVRELLQDSLGLGVIEDFLSDPEITEIMVNSARQIYIEKKGKIQLADKCFASDRQVLDVIERIVAPLGRRIDESSPMVDARLKDGSRVNAIIPPLALRGPCLTIRKFSKRKLTPDDLLAYGSVTAPILAFLKLAVENRKNIVISGGTGSGKTTLLNILASYIPETDRILTIEDSAELNLPQDHVVSLEARPPNIEGTGEIAIRDLVRNSLRMRPDRIVVGECRGGEALDMLQAMNTGHDGSITTVHANTPRDAVARLETMSLMSGTDLPLRAIRDQVASAINIIIQQSRIADGTRKITYVSEMTGLENDTVVINDIFRFKQRGFTKEGGVIGDFVATGKVPEFVKELSEKGVPVDLSLFTPAKA